MGVADPLIVSVATPAYGRVTVDLSDGKTYSADLSSFSKVYCYPATDQWNDVAPDSAGLALVWTSRFEVHVDQIMGLADRVEASRHTA
jgi:hypothetical protein